MPNGDEFCWTLTKFDEIWRNFFSFPFFFLTTNGRAWCPSRHGLGHPSCPPAVSQGKARKRNNSTLFLWLHPKTRLTMKRGTKRVCGRRQRRPENVKQSRINNLERPEWPNYPENPANIQSHKWRPEGMRPKANTGRCITKGRSPKFCRKIQWFDVEVNAVLSFYFLYC